MRRTTTLSTQGGCSRWNPSPNPDPGPGPNPSPNPSPDHTLPLSLPPSPSRLLQQMADSTVPMLNDMFLKEHEEVYTPRSIVTGNWEYTHWEYTYCSGSKDTGSEDTKCKAT